MIKIIIVDDQPLVRQGLSKLIALEDDISVVGTGENGQEALQLIEVLNPEIVLMDIQMPIMDGMSTLKYIRDSNGPPTIILTTFENLNEILTGLKLGAAGYIFKSASIEEITETIRRVHRGERAIHSRVSEALALHATQIHQQIGQEIMTLTVREKDTLAFLIKGYSNKQIAQQMDITEGTIKIHVSNIINKLNAENRLDAAMKAKKMGFPSE